jgi:hypothetical protein
MHRKLAAAAGVAAMALIAVGSGSASGGPGSCVNPGAVISQYAKQPGPNGGPNSPTPWNQFVGVPAGAPNAPGQAVKAECTPAGA